MILKAQMLLYTPVAIDIALQQSLCGKKSLNMYIAFPITTKKYQNENSCSGIFLHISFAERLY